MRKIVCIVIALLVSSALAMTSFEADCNKKCSNQVELSNKPVSIRPYVLCHSKCLSNLEETAHFTKSVQQTRSTSSHEKTSHSTAALGSIIAGMAARTIIQHYGAKIAEASAQKAVKIAESKFKSSPSAQAAATFVTYKVVNAGSDFTINMTAQKIQEYASGIKTLSQIIAEMTKINS